MSEFPSHYILKLFQKFKENFFQNWLLYDYFPDIYSKFLITQLFFKIFPKYKKNFLKIACFKSFLTVPLNFPNIMSISSEFRNTYKFPQNFRILFPQIIPSVRRNFTPYFHKIASPKIFLKFAFKNTYFLKLFPCAAPFPHHCVAAPPPLSSHLPQW